MYIVLPLLDTLTSAPIHTFHFGYMHIHTHIWICTAGMMSVTLVCLCIMCVYVCLCMSVRCVRPKQTPETLLRAMHSQKCYYFDD